MRAVTISAILASIFFFRTLQIGAVDGSPLEKPANRSSRIFGGTVPDRGTYNYFGYVVGVNSDGSYVHCGGAILSQSWAITAAQCVVGVEKVVIFVGIPNVGYITYPTLRRRRFASDRQLRHHIKPYETVAIIHPAYRQNYQINDIALLHLTSPLTYSNYIGPISLFSNDFSKGHDNVNVLTMGMGPSSGTTFDTTNAAVHSIELKNIKKSACRDKTEIVYVSYSTNTGCLMDTESITKGTCYGDAGGPVVYNDDNVAFPRLVGILSQNLECPSAYPSSYTRIYPYLGWIKSVTKRTFF